MQAGATKTAKNFSQGIDKNFGLAHTETKMQLSGNSSQPEVLPATLVTFAAAMRRSSIAIDLPGDDARRLMELGFLPGTRSPRG